MPELKNILLSELKLDLNNYRTVHQKNENDSIRAMIAISSDWFWTLMENIIDDGYYPTDNIIVLEENNSLIVKEGNRRVASLKIIYDQINGIDIPDNIKAKITALGKEWLDKNKSIPCAVYHKDETETVKKIVSLIHAKGEKAGREEWDAVAKARYNRNEKRKKEVGLDLLEKYIENGKNLSPDQKERWSGAYPITVLDELFPKLYSLFGYSSSEELLTDYPQKHRSKIEEILYDIGIQQLGFKEIRNEPFWGLKYGLAKNVTAKPNSQNYPSNTSKSNTSKQENNAGDEEKVQTKTKRKRIAYSTTDVKSVYKKLKEFKPVGNHREKVVLLADEIKKLKIDVHPHSFCFILRSLFEISAKAYCKDNEITGISATKADGNDKNLSDLLREIVGRITSNTKDREKQKLLHGASTELNKKEGMLSVTSFNQLIHNPKFSIQPNDICILFHNIFPLLEEMNK
jgi:hypothetical protein